ncbi:hypothetical protein AO1008_09949 [Aspergillus oryzae 100-8]|uniref:NACHT domain-containing protein n=1 Tax=Aspergillus oryzae (strain 3.042) TaxID=1160506 RepID=I8AD07_ASPO3|nr:hypothetical protein Ao3042_11690 [Aspergillus oryzae 3.042]KDE83407.1 hypothetical protein AO1008_09949 [Aspergillus oryzae 100-8]|eukprot:EIT83074.1 hypothetical protein Ao3042_11690 [Aspergillus oryzae 3.042]
MGCFGLRKLVRKKSSLENNNHRVYTVVHRREAVNPPVHEKEPTKEKAQNVVDDAPSEEILARDESLWNRAYQQLDQGLVNRHEDLLAKQREKINLEKAIQQDAETISNEISGEHLNQFEESTRHNIESTQKLPPLGQRHLEVNIEALNILSQLYEKGLSEDECKCRQLFWLASNDMDSSYESYKSGVPDRLDGTGEWLLEQPHLHQWLEDDKGLLIVSADSGCGKSVLAKHLIDNVLPESCPSATICYFFFKDQVQNTQKQALCALLHQLFTSKPALITLAMKSFSENGDNLVDMLPALWDVLARVLKDPDMGRTVFVLDALDECKESELTGLADKIKSIQKDAESSTKFFLTSRAYGNIMWEFRELNDESPHIHIPGESQSDKFTQEVDIVIKHRVGLLARKKHLNATIQSHLEERLMQMDHRTYLWVQLIFDYLEKHSFRKVKDGIDDVSNLSDQLPTSVNDAYVKALKMNIALHLDLERDELQLESDKDFQVSLRKLCGSLLTVNEKKVVFVHQTAREFLVQENGFSLGSQRSPIDMKEAHRVLAVSCITYINKFMPRVVQTHPADSTSLDLNRAFSNYSAKNWLHHLEAAGLRDGEGLEPYLARICDPKSDAYASWSALTYLVENLPVNKHDERNALWMAASFSMTSVVRRLFQHEEIDRSSNEISNCFFIRRA